MDKPRPIYVKILPAPAALPSRPAPWIDGSELLTVEEAAAKLKLCVRQVREYCVRGTIGFRLGKRWVIPESDLEYVRFRRRGRKPGSLTRTPKAKKPPLRRLKKRRSSPTAGSGDAGLLKLE